MSLLKAMGELSHLFAIAGADPETAVVHVKFAELADFARFDAEVRRQVDDIRISRTTKDAHVYPLIIYGIRLIVEAPR